jgi:hypothetical protein
VPDDEWRAGASPRDKLVFSDLGGLRREDVADRLRRNAAAPAAFDALGEGKPSPIAPDIMRALRERVPWRAVNQLAGLIVDGPGVGERDRNVIWGLLHDVCCRGRIAPDRIKTEQRMRANAGRKLGELALIGRSGELPGLFQQAHDTSDKTEKIFGRTDPLRPPVSVRDIVELQKYVRQFFAETTPTWGLFLGIAWQPGDAVIEVSGEFSLAGKQTALGALAVIIPSLVRRRGRCDALIAEVAGPALGAKFEARHVVRRREVFWEKRGFPSR